MENYAFCLDIVLSHLCQEIYFLVRRPRYLGLLNTSSAAILHYGSMGNKQVAKKTITSSDETQIGIEEILSVGLVKDGLILNSVSDNGIETTSRYKKI